MQRTGQVYKIHSGRYFVKIGEELIECVARGALKIKSDGIVTGDYVKVEENSITGVLPRKNFFIRPNVANIDAVCVVVACPPKPDFYMLDKLLATLFKQSVEVIIAVNKTDLSESTVKEINDNYCLTGAKLVGVSALTGENLNILTDFFSKKLIAFAGQSAVGKTSLVNRIFGFNLRVGEISEKSQRGKHTTTVSEIYEKDGMRILDTPGFSMLRAEIDPEDLGKYYPEYTEYSKNCYFRKCSHTNEPNCAIIEAVESGELNNERYERYKTLYNELKEEKKNIYG